jgi:hypothetical protein
LIAWSTKRVRPRSRVHAWSRIKSAALQHSVIMSGTEIAYSNCAY